MVGQICMQKIYKNPMGPQWHQVIAASRRSHWVSLANSSDPNHTWWDTSGLLVEGFPGKVDG